MGGSSNRKVRGGSPYDATDAWILLAVAMSSGRRSATLRAILGTADYLDHAVPTLEELRVSSGKLIGGGVVVVRSDGLRLAPASRRWFLGQAAKTRATRKLREALKGYLGRKPPPRPARPWAELTSARYQRALADYLGGHSPPQ